MARYLIAGLLLVGTALSFTARAETYHTCKAFIPTVPAVVSSQGVYCLRQDLATGQSTGAAIQVTANNVTIDCNGFKLGGLAAGPATQAYGIYASNAQNMTVRNCNVRGFKRGIYTNGDGHLVEHNTLDQNTEHGIEISGSGNRVRNNLVLDTGNAAYGVIQGIYGSGNTDISDNTVDGVIGPAGGNNTSVYGIRLVAGSGAAVGRNIVRNLVPSGTGGAYGVYTSNGTKIFIDGNRVSQPAAVTGQSIGYRCNASNGALYNNSAWGFATFNSGCFDDGHNASH